MGSARGAAPPEGAFGPTVRLRPTTEDDLGFVLRAEGDGENRPFVGRWTRGRHATAVGAGEMEHLILERSGDGTSVGYAILTGVGSPEGIVCLKRLLIDEKGRGYGRAALGLLKERVFGGLGAHRFWLDVKENNARARRLYGSEGFVVEGVLRDAFWAGDGYESLVVMSVLESEYRV